MRKILLLWLAIWSVSCSPKGYVIDGVVEGMAEGRVCVVSFLKKLPDTLAVAPVEDGRFHIEGECAGVIPAVLMVDGWGLGGLPIYLENARFNAVLDMRNVHNWRIEGGGESQRLSNEYQAIDLAGNRAIDSFRDEFMEAIKEPQSQRFQELQSRVDSILNTTTRQRQLFLQRHADSYVALNDCVVQAYDMPLDNLKAAFERFPLAMRESYAGQVLAAQIRKKESLEPGQPAPDFTVDAPDGHSFSMRSVEAKAKLIDFWASWCAPCRALTPQLRDLYDELHSQGFEIVGISFDDQREAWLRAIEEERLPWPQGSDLRGFAPGVPLMELYAISGIPHLVLLDGDNRIVAVNPPMDQLRDMVIGLLKE